MDGYDLDGDGHVMYSELKNTAIVHTVDVVLGQQVSENQKSLLPESSSREPANRSHACSC